MIQLYFNLKIKIDVLDR